MQITFHRATFSASEAAAITGVSAPLQRDWRRPERGILPPLRDGRHARFGTGELGMLLALKSFTDQGVSVSQAKDAANICILPIESFIDRSGPGANDLSRRLATSFDATPRFVIVSGRSVFRSTTLEQWESTWTGQQSDGAAPALTSIIFDCQAAAFLIQARAPRPLLRTEIGP